MNISKESLQHTLLDILHQHPEGIQEYDFLCKLKEMGLPIFVASTGHDSLSLFKAHFLLFHLLYTLKDQLVARQEGHIDIHCLRIVLRPWQAEESSLPAFPDALRTYYLDITEMEEMQQIDVDNLLETFWQGYFRCQKKPESLAILELEPDASREEIKKRYRELAVRHHPDRGGDTQTFQRISAAARSLLQSS